MRPSPPPVAENLTWHGAELDTEARRRLLGARGAVLWFTGLSGSGKSTVTRRVERLLLEQGTFAYVLDGDNVRHGLCRDLGFSPADRTENIRRIGEVAKLFADAQVLVMAAFVSPQRADRDAVRALLPPGAFIEVFVDTPLEVCAARDPKGLYQRAFAGEIPEFTGVSAPYEAPVAPEVHLRTEGREIEACAQEVISWLRARGYVADRQA
jgi:adenylyl-sulfate kinase